MRGITNWQTRIFCSSYLKSKISEIWPPERIKCNLFQKKVSNIQYIASMYTRRNIFFNISFLVFHLEIRFLGPLTKKKNTKYNTLPPPKKQNKTKLKKKQTQKTYSPKMSLVIRCDKKFEWLYVFPFQPRWHIWAAQATKWTKVIPSRPRKETITQNRQIDDPPGIQTLARMNILEMTHYMYHNEFVSYIYKAWNGFLHVQEYVLCILCILCYTSNNIFTAMKKVIEHITTRTNEYLL